MIIAAIVGAVAIHEGAHVLTAAVLGVKVKRVRFSWLGPYVVREPGTDAQNLAITLAGLLANLATAYLTLRLGYGPKLCFTSLVLGLTNLLPVPHSDGRRALELIRKLVYA